ncbi:MAG: GFA family protein [Sphingomonadaceae bacterium]|nr:GFA family protein [Sphingomonadaceae bacterium]
MTIAGGCQCGAVRYSLQGGPYPVYACHCRECQKQSASAFALSMPVPVQAFAIEGTLDEYCRPASGGRSTDGFFCPACGTRLFHRSSASGAFVTVKAGTLDDASNIQVRAHLWVSRKQPWVTLDPEVPAFDTQPEDMSAWRERLMEDAP